MQLGSAKTLFFKVTGGNDVPSVVAAFLFLKQSIMEKMTIHRALSELKLIDAKIEKQINELIPSGVYQKGKLVEGYITEADFEKSAKSKFDSVNDLIERKNKIN